MKFLSTLRNNWKKTVFGLAFGSYGVFYGRQMYQISTMMKSYSKEAAYYGEQSHQYPKRLVVILNPAANKKKSEKAFKKYCEPILHLSGFIVDIVRTDSEGYAKTYMEQLKSLPNAVVIAGGDGTVSEIITGMMRRNRDYCPIAILPLGLKNDVAKKYSNVSFSSKLKEVESLANAAICIARGYIVEKSVIKIEQLSGNKDGHIENKPIYAMGYLKWGISRDLNYLQDKYWYFGKAKKYCSVLLNAFNKQLSWSCKANIFYTPPCIGCTNCLNVEKSKLKRTWFSFLLKNDHSNRGDLVANNSDCREQYNDIIDSSNVRVYVDDATELNKLVLEKKGNFKPGYTFPYKYLTELQMLADEHHKQQLIECRTMTLVPDEYCKGSSKFYSIDNEVYDVRDISLTLIPKAIRLYMQL